MVAEATAAKLFSEFARSRDGDVKKFAEYGLRHTGNALTRAMGVGEATAGAKAVPPTDFFETFWWTLSNTSPVLRHATPVETDGGEPLEIMTSNDSVVGALKVEGSLDSDEDVAFGSTIIPSYLYSSKMARLSRELAMDMHPAAQRELGVLLGRRVGRIANSHFTTGTGTAQPRGIVTASTLGKTAASQTAVTFNELVDLQHSVDDSYFETGVFMFNANTFKALRKLTDSSARPLWQPSLAGLGTICGSPFVINPAMADMTAGAKSIVFGDCSRYLVRQVVDTDLLVFRERYAEFNQVAFATRVRMGGDLVDAGAVKHLIQAS